MTVAIELGAVIRGRRSHGPGIKARLLAHRHTLDLHPIRERLAVVGELEPEAALTMLMDRTGFVAKQNVWGK